MTSPVVGKTLEIGLVVLFVAFLTTALFGTVVPGYRTAAGDAVGDRVLAHAAGQVERAIPPDVRRATVTARVAVPGTIAGAAYRIETDGRELVLVHPNDGIAGRTRVAVPARVDRLTGTWESGAETVVRVEISETTQVVHLEETA